MNHAWWECVCHFVVQAGEGRGELWQASCSFYCRTYKLTLLMLWLLFLLLLLLFWSNNGTILARGNGQSYSTSRPTRLRVQSARVAFGVDFLTLVLRASATIGFCQRIKRRRVGAAVLCTRRVPCCPLSLTTSLVHLVRSGVFDSAFFCCLLADRRERAFACDVYDECDSTRTHMIGRSPSDRSQVAKLRKSTRGGRQQHSRAQRAGRQVSTVGCSAACVPIAVLAVLVEGFLPSEIRSCSTAKRTTVEWLLHCVPRPLHPRRDPHGLPRCENIWEGLGCVGCIMVSPRKTLFRESLG